MNTGPGKYNIRMQALVNSEKKKGMENETNRGLESDADTSDVRQHKALLSIRTSITLEFLNPFSIEKGKEVMP